MLQRYDAIAISLLIFAAIVVAAISVDPKGFTLRDWQPLIAAILALSGAGIVYRGALLAYEAAMAKVNLDRAINASESKRVALGVCLRLDYSLKVLIYEAENSAFLTLAGTSREPKTVTLDEVVVFSPETAMDEAWISLDRFPPKLAEFISQIRGGLYDVKTLQQINKGNQFTLSKVLPDPQEVIRMKQYLRHLAKEAAAARKLLRQLILTLEA
jgi:hypothetical protein